MASDEEEFEYYVKFPEPGVGPGVTGAGKDQDSRTNEERQESDAKIPVVVLLGWAGCQDKYLSKYSAIYEERGFITLRTTAPLTTLFVHRASMCDLAGRLVSTLYDLRLHQHPLVFHLFSNGGSYLYGHVLNELEARPLQIRGIIFDSSPGRKRFSSLWGALTAILGGRVMAFFAAAALALMWAAQTAWHAFVLRRKEPYGDPFNPLLADPSKCPQLCLYSQEDKLIAAQDVQDFIAIRQQQGVDVTAVCFHDSQHVRHLMAHRDTYIDTVLHFLRKCLPEIQESCQTMSYHA